MRLGLSFTTAGSCTKAWPIGVVEKTRSDTRLSGAALGFGNGVAAHPVAQLKPQVTPVTQTRQGTHRPHHPRTHTFHTIYDSENKQAEVRNSSSVILGQYWYDGDGKRIKKYVPGTGEVTVFVYDAAGKQIAEYSTIVASSGTATVSYLTADHLGSPRINTDANGAVISRHDYHPFGEEIDGTGGRTTGLNYGDDGVRKQFTGYERDGEAGLDFAQARMYSPQLARFQIPDPENAGVDQLLPQTWNGYSYVINNPSIFTDPSGLVYLRQGNSIFWMDDQYYNENKDTDEFKEKYGGYNLLSYGKRTGPRLPYCASFLENLRRAFM